MITDQQGVLKSQSFVLQSEREDSYNYDEEAHSAAYVPADKNQSNEPDEDYNTSEGLLCEEDTEDSFFSDDLNQ